MSLPNCPKCNSEYVYEDGILLVCPECAYGRIQTKLQKKKGLWFLIAMAHRPTVTPLQLSKI